ncbi:hypothetical protein Tco_1437991 [Tanacetum coccineum]
MVKKKETIYAADHIIPDLEFALELDIMQALKESKKTSRRQPGTRVSNEGTGVSPGVLDESTVVPATSSEGTGDDEEVDWIESDEDEEKKDDTDDDKSIDLKMNDDEETDDEFVHGDEQVNNDEDEEMLNAEVEDSRKGDAEISDVAKVDAEKIEEIKDDAKKAELPLTSSNLSVSSGFGDQFLKLLSDTSLVSTVKDITDAEINCLLGIKIQSKVLHIKYPSVLRVPVFAIFEPLILSPIQETSTVVLITTLPLPSVSTISLVPHKTTTPIPKPPITNTDACQPTPLRHDDLQKVLQRHTADLIQKYFMKPAPENPANHELYHDLMEALIEDENAMDKGVADIIKSHKQQNDDDDDEDPPTGLNQGKKTKRRRTKEPESSKKTSTTRETPKGKAPSKGSKTVVARDEKWVPSTERVKISSTNVRMETTVQQKEETFQVVIDVIKNSTCFKAFTITAEKCIVDVEVFRKILDICPRVEVEEFTDVQVMMLSSPSSLTLATKVYYTNIPTCMWIICISHGELWQQLSTSVSLGRPFRKTLLSRLITGRRENQDIKLCHSPDLPKSSSITSSHNTSLSLTSKFQHYHTIKDDGIVSRLKFVRIGEDY